jgi:capsular polysaccharide biosynthesis protein
MYRLFTLRLIETYFRHRWLYLIPIVVMAVAAGIYLTFLKMDYQSQGVLYVNDKSLLASLSAINVNNSNMWLTPAQATANEINQLVRTDAFIRAIIHSTDLEKNMSEGPTAVNQVFSDIRARISVTTLGDNQTLISVTTSSSDLSYQLVNSLIENYIQWKINSQKTESLAAVKFFSDLIDQYKASLETNRSALKTYMDAHPAPVRGERPFSEQFEIDRLNSEIKIAQDRYTGALDKEENAKLAVQQVETDSRQTYTLVDAPKIALRSTTSTKSIAISLAIFVGSGLLLTIILVVGSSLLDRTVRFPLDVTYHLGLSVLAVIPTSRPVKKSRQSGLLLVWNQAKQVADSILSRAKIARQKKANVGDFKQSV